MNLSKDSLLELIDKVSVQLKRYRIILFALVVCGVYGFLLYRIGSLNSAQPDPSSTLVVKQSPHIDKTVVQQLESLKDNSVNVKTLFNKARQNPFHE